MNKRRLIVGITALIVMLPFVLTGFLWNMISTYFVSGVEMAEIIAEDVIEKWLEQYDE